jgi:uncharacterized protein YkwD
MKNILFFIFILINLAVFPQAKWNIKDYEKYNNSNFRKNPLFNKTIDFNKIDYPRLNAAIFYVTNEIRINNNLKSLEYSPELEISSWNHARLMVKNNFFSHYNTIDKTHYSLEQRGILAGITNPHLAENIADSFGIQYEAGVKIYILDKQKGLFSYEYNGEAIPNHTYLSFAEALLKIWMNSPPHKANILSDKAVQLGCGAYFYIDKNFYNIARFRAVQNFQWYKKIIPSNEQTKELKPE